MNSQFEEGEIQQSIDSDQNNQSSAKTEQVEQQCQPDPKKKKIRKRKKKKNKKPKQIISSTYKAKKCEFYMKGACTKGDKCQFSHNFLLEKSKKICKFYLSGACSKGINCFFSHNLKAYPCKFFHLQRVCNMGNQCRFSHNVIPEGEFEDFLIDNKDYLQQLYNNKRLYEPYLINFVQTHCKIQSQFNKMNIPSFLNPNFSSIKTNPNPNLNINMNQNINQNLNKNLNLPMNQNINQNMNQNINQNMNQNMYPTFQNQFPMMGYQPIYPPNMYYLPSNISANQTNQIQGNKNQILAMQNPYLPINQIKNAPYYNQNYLNYGIYTNPQNRNPLIIPQMVHQQNFIGAKTQNINIEKKQLKQKIVTEQKQKQKQKQKQREKQKERQRQREKEKQRQKQKQKLIAKKAQQNALALKKEEVKKKQLQNKANTLKLIKRNSKQLKKPQKNKAEVKYHDPMFKILQKFLTYKL